MLDKYPTAKKLYEELNDMSWKIGQLESLEKSTKSLRESDKVQGDKIKELQHINRNTNILLSAYICKFGETFEICPDCDGDGGFDCGEYGEECERCQGSGIIEKESVK